MIKKGDIIQFRNYIYSAEGQQESQTEYYIVKKIPDKCTLILDRIDKPMLGNKIYTIGNLKGKYSIYAE